LFAEIQARVKIPLISIVEAVKAEAQRLNLKKVGLIGTKYTMKATFYADLFKKSGIEIIVPSAPDIELINHKLFSELELGIIKDDTRAEMLGVVAKMLSQHHIDSLILGCTEMPIMFTHEQYLGIPFLNSTQIHAKAIVETCLIA
jgi:aspartate racemase